MRLRPCARILRRRAAAPLQRRPRRQGRPQAFRLGPVPDEHERSRHGAPRLYQLPDPLLGRQTAGVEERLAGSVPAGAGPDEVGLNADALARESALDMFLADEVADGEVKADAVERANGTVQGERERERRARRPRAAVAAVDRAAPRNASEAVLAASAVADEGRR